MYEFAVFGKPATGGVGILLCPTMAKEIESPLATAARDALGIGHDSAEDVEPHTLSDGSESSIAVLTDIDASCASNTSDNESDFSTEHDTHPTAGSSRSTSATGGASPAKGDYIITPGMFDTDTTKPMTTTKRSRVASGPRLPPQPALFDNGYFRMSYRFDQDSIRMEIRKNWTHPPPNGMGKRLHMSKSLHRSTFGEDLANSTRTRILLRAWMLWRARANGFADAAVGRKRLFDDETDKLTRDIRKLQPQRDGLLGKAAAAVLLQGWAPEVHAIFAP